MKTTTTTTTTMTMKKKYTRFFRYKCCLDLIHIIQIKNNVHKKYAYGFNASVLYHKFVSLSLFFSLCVCPSSSIKASLTWFLYIATSSLFVYNVWQHYIFIFLVEIGKKRKKNMWCSCEDTHRKLKRAHCSVFHNFFLHFQVYVCRWCIF